MIFVTVGTQLPFPRLLDAVNDIMSQSDIELIAQTCDPMFRSDHFESYAKLSPDTFEEYFRAAEKIIGHAGIGTLLSAKKYGKPLIIYPRRAALGEHRNDHQMATAKFVDNFPGVYWAKDDAMLASLIANKELEPADNRKHSASQELLSYVQSFIDKA